ncbi:hypothetical protein [Comamonas testosteroni]|uniref:Uncharacterized protein n=1 Tax=Comamonas testosteroni TaxID=285 RepID=A0A8B4RZV5_COMTE|nr:hypothetical protein [Comamonas testosteroni]EHN66597.1 hypothetical protein CTATCC11996_05703 [Comamonas testosteroni ATCC 11996]QQN70285.1 hypothetical protein IYN88_02325 [Comamonas testosteroni]SUY75367.1 Uncharacterised protein [Comamonas testosteroni]
MDFVASVNHLLNFVAPAFFLALGLAVCARIFKKNKAGAQSFIVQVAINFILGAAVLLASLWLFSRDGKMLGYAALVCTSACCQWVLSRAWR